MAEHSVKNHSSNRPVKPKAIGVLNKIDHRFGPNAQPLHKIFDQPIAPQEESQEEKEEEPNASFFIDTQEDHQQAITDFVMFVLLWIALPAWLFSELVLTLSL